MFMLFLRAAVKPGLENSLFIPYNNLFNKDKSVGEVIQAKAIAIHPNMAELDREVEEFGSYVPFSHLIYAAGTTIPSPDHLEAHDKAKGIGYLQLYQDLIRQSGAVGLELAAEIKDYYPEKEVTLIHSRHQYLAPYKYSLHSMTYNLLKNKLGVHQIMGDCVDLPKDGFPLEVRPLVIKTKKGRSVEADLAPTLQIRDDRYPHIYAVGDVIESTDIKTGHYAWYHYITALDNIVKEINGEEKAVMQTNSLGPLVTLRCWIVGNSVPDNLYADISWRLLNADPEDEAD
ncbi:hypothetical protein BGW37DRAFT_514837 [Umbelopsis sp. PMI_123]|nr:hypothetical protein BGW37DRAFT_514837 [Umbelopsis sp. PMI_123]